MEMLFEGERSVTEFKYVTESRTETYDGDLPLVRFKCIQGAALSPLLLNVASEYVMRNIQENQEELKFNGVSSFWSTIILIYWIKT
jgi:hypothetical protein